MCVCVCVCVQIHSALARVILVGPFTLSAYVYRDVQSSLGVVRALRVRLPGRQLPTAVTALRLTCGELDTALATELRLWLAAQPHSVRLLLECECSRARQARRRTDTASL